MASAIDGSDQRIDLLTDVTPGAEVPPASQGTVQPTQQTPPVETTQTALPASQPADQPTAFRAPPAAAQADVIQTQDTNLESVVGELIECRRHEGVLNIKVRFRNNSDKAASLTFVHWGAAGVDLPKFYVTAGNKKYFTLTDADGTVLSSNSANADASLAPGKTYLWWGKYPAPPAEVTKIDLMIPVTAPFEDVPITDK
jgi:hypothetical protein